MFKHLALLVTLIVPLSLQGEKPFRELIFQPGSALVAMSHASTVVELRGGNLMAAWR